MVVGLDPGLRPRAGVDSAAVVDALLAAGAPGRSLDVPADADRRHLRPAEVIDRLALRERGARGAPCRRRALDARLRGRPRGGRPRARARHRRSRGRLARAPARGAARVAARGAGARGRTGTARVQPQPARRHARAATRRSRCSTRRPAWSPSSPATRTATGSGPRTRGRLLADRHLLAGRPPAAVPRAAALPHAGRLRARDLDARPRRARASPGSRASWRSSTPRAAGRRDSRASGAIATRGLFVRAIGARSVPATRGERQQQH